MIWLISACILHSQIAWAISESVNAVGSVETVSSVDGMFEQLAPLTSALDESKVDLEEKVFALNFDSAEIVRFVTDEIGFQAYPGLLRSAHGTLISQSGNALDQGVLLAKLLNDAGYEARVVQGRLSMEDAQRLLMQMKGPSTWPSAWEESGQSRVESWVRQKSGGIPSDEALGAEFDRIVGESVAAHDTIRAQVEAIVDRGGSGSMVDRLVRESLDYFWVEHRLGPGDPWQSTHPAFAGAPPPSPEAQGYLADTIPANLQHRVRIAVKAETRSGGAIQVADLMTPWERPAANAAYRPQTIAVLPYNGQTADSNAYLETAATQAEMFALTWNEGLAPGAKVFTLEGDILPLDALSAAGGAFKRVSDKTSAATNALSGLGLSKAEQAEQAPAKRLERLWIEYSIIAPGGQVRTMQRHLLDLGEDGTRFVHQQPVSEQEWAPEARAALLQSRSLLAATGPVNPGWLTRALLDSASEGRATLRALEQRAAESDASIGPQILNGLDPLPDTRWIKYLFATHTSTGFGDSGVAYLHQPALVSFNHGVRKGQNGLRAYEQIDILFNARRVLELTGEGLISAPGTAALAGVMQTQAEYRQLQSRGAEIKNSAFQQLSGFAGEMLRISPTESAALAKSGMTPGALRAAERELSAGYALLVPRTSDVDYWWRIDPSTGTATGMGITSGGYGGVTVAEFLFVLGLVAGTLLMYIGFYNCFTGDDTGLALFCCLVDSWLTGIIVAAFAFVAAQATAAALLALEGTVAVGPGVTTLAAEYKLTEMVIAITNFILWDGGSAAISFTDFRIAACGTLTGT